MKTLSKHFTINFSQVPNRLWIDPNTMFASLGMRLITGPLGLYMALARYDLVKSFRDYVVRPDVSVHLAKPELIDGLINSSDIVNANFIRAYVDWRLNTTAYDFDFKVIDIAKSISMLPYIDSCFEFSY
ncbi:hypothetical protein HCY52_07835 [Acinetobacter radioresistens]|uniref:hypothetical protein n=1 Tax=Acinetobacter radioresistens TaxID=40216 RepID=UPI0020063B80|nr:hypothetical protein [Acinetobacter radioresistens]MCK4083724.1 hypothetical protein [Acinetobacter radioresistens]